MTAAHPPRRAFLNVGGGAKHISVPGCFAGWRHDILDVNPEYQPDICLDARQIHTLAPAIYDAVYCSHNLEHYHHHEVVAILNGFHHVLKPDGFVHIGVPDAGVILRHVVQYGLDLDDELYTSASGPILVRDTIWGFHKQIQGAGGETWAHRTGFTGPSLLRLLTAGGFPNVGLAQVKPFDLVAIGFKQQPTPEQCELVGVSMRQS